MKMPSLVYAPMEHSYTYITQSHARAHTNAISIGYERHIRNHTHTPMNNTKYKHNDRGTHTHMQTHTKTQMYKYMTDRTDQKNRPKDETILITKITVKLDKFYQCSMDFRYDFLANSEQTKNHTQKKSDIVSSFEGFQWFSCQCSQCFSICIEILLIRHSTLLKFL